MYIHRHTISHTKKRESNRSLPLTEFRSHNTASRCPVPSAHIKGSDWNALPVIVRAKAQAARGIYAYSPSPYRAISGLLVPNCACCPFTAQPAGPERRCEWPAQKGGEGHRWGEEPCVVGYSAGREHTSRFAMA